MSSVDFALIGHLESWSVAAALVSALRGPERLPIPLQDIREILPWIPPRTVCRVTACSSEGNEAHGVYIDSFIPPGRLEEAFWRENLLRVRQSAKCAVRERARIATLGGFSSILLEGKTEFLPRHPETAFTTGNTLTVAFIIRGIERALDLALRDLSEANVLIIGATGDVGSGCARCLAPRVKRLFLYARNSSRLEELANELSGLGSGVEVQTDLRSLTRRADLVICVASLPAPALLLEALPPAAIVCDAGYPKNLQPGFEPPEGAIFFGGLGQVSVGMRLDPDLLGILNPYPFPNVVHGCLLEGITLALEGRFEPFSRGRGLITPPRVKEIWEIAQKHGIVLAPLFNSDGPVEEKITSLACKVRR
jgi:fatty aldehyde-generating acyl-ACP reductase